jgi:methylglutaconyl-CoA hydratase
MKYDNIYIEIDNQVATIWLDQPELKNALDGTTFSELIKAIKEFKASKQIRMLILRGRNDIFSSGANLNWMFTSGQLPWKKNYKNSKLIADCLNELYNFPKPVICLAQGIAFGGAIGLLAACDIVIATQETRFAFSEVRLGLAPSTILPYILKRINPSKASLLIYSARPFGAVEAEKIGLADIVVNEAEAEMYLKNLIADMTKASPDALFECKKMIRLSSDSISKKLIKQSIRSITELKQSKDGQEGLRAFFEKREPLWANK